MKEAMHTHLECYGGMFPDLSRQIFNTPLKGKAFEVMVGSSGLGITDRTSSVNLEEWTRCTACSEYSECYQLSSAKLLLNAVTQEYGMARNV